MRSWVLLMLACCVAAAAAGCAETRWAQRQPTQSDTAFGGGFPSSHRPGGDDDPTDRNLRRTEVRPTWRSDNGAPETRVGGGAPPDARIGAPDARTR